MKKALIIGFVGRNNSGDEMMLEMHIHLLEKLGFSQVDITTEWHEDIIPGYRYPIKKNSPQPYAYDLVLIGGGALGPGFGFFPALYYKFNFNSKVIMSSVNLDSRDPRYLSIMRSACDLVIVRSVHQYHLFKQDFPQLVFLPDVSTVYRPVRVPVQKNKIAVIIREHVRPVIQYSPSEPFDVLVLSQVDRKVSVKYAQKHGACVIDVAAMMPQKHVDLIASYERVLSAGRFHAALYAMNADCDFVYWPARSRKGTPESIVNRQGKLSWNEIKCLAEQNQSLTKAGLTQNQWMKYGKATEEQYLEEFKKVLDSSDTKRVMS